MPLFSKYLLCNLSEVTIIAFHFRNSSKILNAYKEYSKENPTAQLLTYINGLMYYLNSDEVHEDNLDPKFLKLIYRQFENGNLPTKYLLFFPRSLGYDGMEDVYIQKIEERKAKSQR